MDTKRPEDVFEMLTENDIRWLLAEHNALQLLPIESAPAPLVALGLIDRVMIQSGRNPVYGYQMSKKGDVFCSWLKLAALNEYIARRKR